MKWRDRPLAQQAGALCTSPLFWAFMRVHCEDECAEAVRTACDVTSRAEIEPDTMAGDRWRELVERFHGWQAACEVGVA